MDKDDTLALLRSLLISKNGSYELQELMRDFKGEAGHPIPLFGYKTTLDFLKSIPDTVQLVHSYHKIMVKPVDNSKTAHIASLVRRQKYVGNKRRSGFRFSTEMDYEPFETDTNIELCRVRMDTKEWDNSKPSVNGNTNIKNEKINKKPLVKKNVGKIKTVRSDFEVDHKKIKTPSCNGTNSDHDQSITDKNSLEMEKNIVDDILKDLNELPKLNLESFAEIDNYVEVCVPVICSPHNFTIQLRRFKIKFLNLMMEIQLFYNRSGDKYRISESGLEINQLCVAPAAIHSDSADWCRAILLEYKDKHNAVVGLIDYGFITEVDFNKIRYMHHWFGKLPPQAISGHLANIRPCRGIEWSDESTERFRNLVFERDLVAGVVDVDYEEVWMSVALSFTDGTELHINDTLVEENLAVFGSPVVDSQIWGAGKKGGLSVSNPIAKYWFHSKDIIEPQNKKTEMKKKHSEANRNIFFSYSESNVRLHEMFRQ